MNITKLAYTTIEHYEGEVTPATVQTMIDAGWVEIVNGIVQVVK